MAIEIDTEDGFKLVHDGTGWNIHAPAPDLSDLPDELLEALVYDRRAAPDPNYTGPERRLGVWFAWAMTEKDALVKIAEERRLGLFH